MILNHTQKEVAEITNQDEVPLLPGKVNMFVESDYLGQIDLIDVIVPNQTFKMPFGIDKRIEVVNSIKSYNKIWKSSKIITKQIDEIKIINNSSDTLEVVIEHPLPVSLDSKVKVKVGEILPVPDEQEKNGMAKWKLVITPQQSQIIDIPIRIEYPKNMKVEGLK